MTEEERVDIDFSWLTKNVMKLQKKYAGKWVAVINKKIAGAGKTAREAFDHAVKKYPQKKPLLGVIPTGECLIL